MTTTSANHLIENKVEIGRYMDSTDAVIDYYRNLDKPKEVKKNRKSNTTKLY